mmetsp:Transcript_21410/g.68228  ORF Transcript_21410/g.68228 Transcript_21410/m.68228 type:complete len:100 (-) Transcript_21410:574-873(-)
MGQGSNNIRRAWPIHDQPPQIDMEMVKRWCAGCGIIVKANADRDGKRHRQSEWAVQSTAHPDMRDSNDNDDGDNDDKDDETGPRARYVCWSENARHGTT